MTHDVIVVGSGAAGLTAALALAEKLKVLVLAKGDLTGTTAPDSLGRAIAPAFGAADLTDTQAALLRDNRMGEAILSAIEKIERGVQGEVKDVTDGLALFRAVGLEGTARRTALELMLLERRG